MAGGNKGKVIRSIIVFFVVLLVLIVGVGAMIRFDVLGMGTKYLGPYIQNVPILSMILPEMPVEEGADDTYNFETVEEAVEILQITEKMLKESDEKAEELSEQLEQLTAEVTRLSVFEANQLQFEEDKAAFDALIASSSDPVDFTEWFESMYPKNAADIYADVVGEVVISQELKDLVGLYENMKPSQAAAILESMATTRLAQTTQIIKNLSSDQGADILGAMDADTAAKITTYLYPEE